MSQPGMPPWRRPPKQRGTGGHSYYYTMGSESLHSMAAIASGHGDALGQMGALAGERMPLRVGIRAETIELPFGLGEIDLPGVDVQLPGELWDPESQQDPASVTAAHFFDARNHF